MHDSFTSAQRQHRPTLRQTEETGPFIGKMSLLWVDIHLVPYPHSCPLGEFVNGSFIAEDAGKLKGLSARVIADWLAVY
jgi:hypothetical protein